MQAKVAEQARTPWSHFAGPTATISLVLIVPLAVYLLWGATIEAVVRDWFDPPPSRYVIAMATVAALASDIVLPVPSSFVSTLAGAELGLLLATLCSWLGLTLGSIAGFAAARWLGPKLAAQWAGESDLARLNALTSTHAPTLIAITRPLPLLAEATVFVLGGAGLRWRRFLPSLLLSNFGVALAYSALGLFAHEMDDLPLALTASIAIPLAATMVARLIWPRSPARSSIEAP